MTISLSEHTLQIFAVSAAIYSVGTQAIRAVHDVMLRRIALQKAIDKRSGS